MKVLAAVLTTGQVALSWWPLTQWTKDLTAAWVTFGLVYAVLAAALGWWLFEKREGDSA